MIPGVGRAVWSAGSSGGGTGRTNDWNTYDGTEDTAWQQWVDETSTALTNYDTTKTEKNHLRGPGTSYIAVNGGGLEYLGVVTPDTADATSAQITLYGPYNMKRAELNQSGSYIAMTSLTDDGSVVFFKDAGGVTESGKISGLLSSINNADDTERHFSLFYKSRLRDTSGTYSANADDGWTLIIGGKYNGNANLSSNGIGTRYYFPCAQSWFSWDIDAVLSSPSDGLSPGQPRNGWWNVASQTAVAYIPPTAYHPNNGQNGNAGSDGTFINKTASIDSNNAEGIVRPLFLGDYNRDFNDYADGNNSKNVATLLDWRTIRPSATNTDTTFGQAVGWSIHARHYSPDRNPATTSYYGWDLIPYNDNSGSNSVVPSPTQGTDTPPDWNTFGSIYRPPYPIVDIDPCFVNNDRVQYISNGGRSTTELGEDFVQAIQLDNGVVIGMYPDTTGTKGGNLYLNAVARTSEDYYKNAITNTEMEYVIADDVTTEESHASSSIAVSITNGSDSTSTAYDPDQAVLFKLYGDYFAVLWRKSTTAYISVFSAAKQTSAPVSLTREVDTVNLGTVPAGNVSGCYYAPGVAMITCGDKYRFIKVPV